MRPPALIALLSLAACADSAGPPPAPLGFGAEVAFVDRREIEVGFEGGGGIILSGTLILPPAPGRYPAIVMHFGSDRWTRARFVESNLRFWTENGIAVLTYDKRGVGRSQGTCCPYRAPLYFRMLGEDVAGGVRLLQDHPEIEPRGIGAWGFSQGGWVVPAAGTLLGDELAFVIIGSGPTVSVGEELLYSRLTGDAACTPSGRSAGEIERRLDQAGPSLHDPRPDLRAMTAPGLWIYGALDTSVPVARSVAVLERLAARQGKDYTALVLPRLNHSWILDGAMCQTEGPGGIDGAILIDWLAPRLAARGLARGRQAGPVAD